MTIRGVFIPPKAILDESAFLGHKANQLGFTAEINIAKISDQEKQDLKDKCVEFESIFVKMILTLMRKNTKSLGLEKKLSNQENDLYHDLLDTEYSKVMSKSNQTFGIGDMIYRQLTTPVIPAKEVVRRYTNF